MAANKKNAKGNKTAHVLNLLTAPGAAREGAPAGEEVTEPAAEPAAAPSRPLLPPILEVAQANDDSLAQQIQRALEEELEEEPTAPPAPLPAQTNVEEVSPMATELPVKEQPLASPAPSGGKMSQEEIEKLLAAASAPAEEPAPQPQPAPPEKPAPAPQPAPPPQEDEDVSYTNIMEVLVEEKAAGYMKKFGLCTCKQCTADVKALTLTNLVPKYVVLSKLDRIPMLTVYEGRFNSTIFAQLTRACKIVMDHPHHKRREN